MTAGFVGRRGLILAAIALLAAAIIGYVAWQRLSGGGLPSGFASGNGRIEAVAIDISAKVAGRIGDILVNEGDFVTAGQELARMDTAQLRAQLRQAEAEQRRAEIGVETATSFVRQREAEKRAAEATIGQRRADNDATQRQLSRSIPLAHANTIPQSVLDNDRAAAESTAAGLAAAEAQLAAADAAISAAQASVVDAGAAVDAAAAAIEAIQVSIDDSTLRAPRDGRVQFRVAQPGEVVAAGGRVLNMVDLSDVYMTFFLPTAEAGRVAIGTEVRLVLDAAPQWVVPASVRFVADVAQFTPKTVETEEERQKLMFRVRAQVPKELLQRYIQYVKTGLPGMAYVRLDPEAQWPEFLSTNLVQ
ncbi:HlyD family secretion protein [Amaricoccus macauensis]|uniref:HlyD family secretion protein n=1 Tax=Amaricoccus macauensis TaxID=57001 RepID=A0A840SLJ5_9RHOB|nr:HlyD family efflux transporter periplasmic adaptor subunit [Amaricoccus macauensis]MBB5221834.1 HlyD family secretion protein [Amaricoccus macauensis]